MKRFEKFVIVTDIDGTFISDKEALVERNLTAIEYFKAHGGRFTVASGRAAEHIRGSIPCVDELVNIPAVTCNGANLYDYDREETVESYPMDTALIGGVVEFVRQNYPKAGIRASAEGYCFVSTPEDMKNPLVDGDFKRYNTTNHFISPVEAWSELDVYKIVLRIDEADILEAMDKLRETFGERVSVTQSWATIIDVQRGGINKGTTLERYVRRTLGEDVRIYACGDYLNDLEMLNCADVAVCPSNAHPKIKEVSRLCLCSNNEGLIADLVDHIEKEIKNEA